MLRFEPAISNGGVCWNPFDELRIGTDNEVGDVQNMATLMVDPDGKGLESHWQKTAQALLVGLFLHALYKAKNEGTTASLPAVDAMLSDPNSSVAELWMEMCTYSHANGQKPSCGGFSRQGHDGPSRRRSRFGAVYGQVVFVSLPRPDCRQECQPIRFPN